MCFNRWSLASKTSFVRVQFQISILCARDSNRTVKSDIWSARASRFHLESMPANHRKQICSRRLKARVNLRNNIIRHHRNWNCQKQTRFEAREQHLVMPRQPAAKLIPKAKKKMRQKMKKNRSERETRREEREHKACECVERKEPLQFYIIKKGELSEAGVKYLDQFYDGFVNNTLRRSFDRHLSHHLVSQKKKKPFAPLILINFIYIRYYILRRTHPVDQRSPQHAPNSEPAHILSCFVTFSSGHQSGHRRLARSRAWM